MATNIPFYKAFIGDELDGIFAISLVDMPAVERDFVCFKKEDEKYQKFSISNEDEHLVTGVVMLADTPIYRRDGDFEYYLVFTKETIKDMAQKMLQNGTQNNVDLQHDGKLINGISMVELFIKDSAKGIEPNFVSDVPDGSLMATFHVEDEELWQKLHTDEINGFSLEGYFSYSIIENNNMKNNTNKLMKKITETMSKIEEILKGALMSFGSVTTDQGVINWDGEDEIAVGVEVYGLDENGERVEIADGEYKAEDGKIITVAESKVTEIKDAEEPAQEDEPAPEPAQEEETEEEVVEEIVEEQPVEEKPNEVDELKGEIAKLHGEIEEIKEQMKGLEDAIKALANEPAAEPIVEEFKAIVKTDEKAPKGAKKAASILAHLND